MISFKQRQGVNFFIHFPVHMQVSSLASLRFLENQFCDLYKPVRQIQRQYQQDQQQREQRQRSHGS